jgi:hypothetical protein
MLVIQFVQNFYLLLCYALQLRTSYLLRFVQLDFLYRVVAA